MFGEPAISRDEALVAAHVNGWYISGVHICADCRVKIAPTEENNEEKETQG
jgi:hypothetical protein